VLFAAMTSAVALLEAVVSQFGDGLTLRRHRAIVVSLCIIIPLGLLVVFGFGPLMTDFSPFDQGAGWLGILDTLSNTIIMPIVAIATCLFVTFGIGVKSITDEVESCGNRFRSKTMFIWMVRVICPLFLAIMLILGLLDMYGVFTVY
jgi:NSS family neurotransmitter:Na+ symporter